jgi:hypothetical protein
VKIDTNDDNEIQILEAMVIDSLYIIEPNVEKFTGILGFGNLKKLFFQCAVPSFDATSFTQLKKLISVNMFNSTTILSVAGMSWLEELYCTSNAPNTIDFLGLSSLRQLEIVYDIAPDFSTLANLEVLDLSTSLLPDFSVFPYLERLTLLTYEPHSLTIDNLPNLQYVQFNGVQSEQNPDTMALTNLPALKKLIVNFSGCSSLDLTGTPNIEDVRMNMVQLSTIESVFPTIRKLEIHLNYSFQSLDVSNAQQLEWLAIPYCGALNNLDCSNATSLNHFEAVTSDSLGTINLNGCTALTSIGIINNPQLQSVLLKNGRNEQPQIEECENLAYFCVYESEVTDFVSWYPDAEINTYCTAARASNPNMISGNVSYDFTNSGCASLDAKNFVKIKKPARYGRFFYVHNS